jgi:hypothetical protein
VKVAAVAANVMLVDGACCAGVFLRGAAGCMLPKGLLHVSSLCVCSISCSCFAEQQHCGLCSGAVAGTQVVSDQSC